MSERSYWLLVVACLSLFVGLKSIHVGRRTSKGVVAQSFVLAVWLVGLAMLVAGYSSFAERVLPVGMLLAGAFAQAASDTVPVSSRRIVHVAWGGSVVITLVGFFFPSAYYGPGARGMGPLFAVVAAISVAGTLAMKWWLWSLAMQAQGRERRRRLALFFANVLGALGGGGLIALYIIGIDITPYAAPLLLATVATVAFATWAGEETPVRASLVQGGVSVAVTVVLVVLLISVFLTPFGFAWPVVYTPYQLLLGTCGLLVFEALRQVVEDAVTQRFFQTPQTVRALQSAVERETERAEHAEQLAEIGRIASGVAHEIRNPLGVILAELKVLELGGAEKESTEAIRAQVKRASRFVDELLNYAKPKPLQVVEVELHELVKQAIDRSVRALGAEAGRVHATVPPLRLEVDGEAIGDVLVNLVSNALIASPHAEVRVSAERLEGAFVLKVEDDGPGVPVELEPKLFQAFVTGRARDAVHTGTGLGLALCRRIVERHGGTLRHERPSHGGARFVVTLPVHAV